MVGPTPPYPFPNLGNGGGYHNQGSNGGGYQQQQGDYQRRPGNDTTTGSGDAATLATAAPLPLPTCPTSSRT